MLLIEEAEAKLNSLGAIRTTSPMDCQLPRSGSNLVSLPYHIVRAGLVDREQSFLPSYILSRWLDLGSEVGELTIFLRSKDW